MPHPSVRTVSFVMPHSSICPQVPLVKRALLRVRLLAGQARVQYPRAARSLPQLPQRRSRGREEASVGGEGCVRVGGSGRIGRSVSNQSIPFTPLSYFTPALTPRAHTVPHHLAPRHSPDILFLDPFPAAGPRRRLCELLLASPQPLSLQTSPCF
jgi:hypothetical protein